MTPPKAEYIGADQLPFFSLATLRRTIHSEKTTFQDLEYSFPYPL